MVKFNKTYPAERNIFGFINSIPFPVYILDNDDKIIITNASFDRLCLDVFGICKPPIGWSHSWLVEKTTRKGVITEAVGCEDRFIEWRLNLHRRTPVVIKLDLWEKDKENSYGDAFYIKEHITDEGLCIITSWRGQQGFNTEKFIRFGDGLVQECTAQPISNGSSFIADNILSIPSNKFVLTNRQLECAKWAIAGKTYDEIAIITELSARTVRHHLNLVKEKYDFASVTQMLVQVAIDHHLNCISFDLI